MKLHDKFYSVHATQPIGIGSVVQMCCIYIYTRNFFSHSLLMAYTACTQYPCNPSVANREDDQPSWDVCIADPSGLVVPQYQIHTEDEEVNRREPEKEEKTLHIDISSRHWKIRRKVLRGVRETERPIVNRSHPEKHFFHQTPLQRVKH